MKEVKEEMQLKVESWQRVFTIEKPNQYTLNVKLIGGDKGLVLDVPYTVILRIDDKEDIIVSKLRGEGKISFPPSEIIKYIKDGKQHQIQVIAKVGD